jgi:hypothetical protein
MRTLYDTKTKQLTLVRDKQRIQLTAEETAELVRECVTIAHDCEIQVIPPYCIVVSLPYSDFGGDQDTESYGFGVTVDGPPALVHRVRAALANELEHTEIFDDAEPAVPDVPELKYRVEDFAVVTSPEQALSRLRLVLLAHQSDSITADSPYWENVGFSEEEAEDISGALWSANFDYDGSVADFLKQFLEGAGDLDDQGRLLARLTVWANGGQIEKAADDEDA